MLEFGSAMLARAAFENTHTQAYDVFAHGKEVSQSETSMKSARLASDYPMPPSFSPVLPPNHHDIP